jgi:hypothetical protein
MSKHPKQQLPCGDEDCPDRKPYENGNGTGFMVKMPSRAAMAIIGVIAAYSPAKDAITHFSPHPVRPDIIASDVSRDENQVAVIEKLNAIETKQDELSKRLDHLENRIDKVIDRPTR